MVFFMPLGDPAGWYLLVAIELPAFFGGLGSALHHRGPRMMKTRNPLLSFCALVLLGMVYLVQRHAETGRWHWEVPYYSLGPLTFLIARRLWLERKARS